MTLDPPRPGWAHWSPLLCLLAAAFVATGSFMPLFVTTIRLGHPNVELVSTVTAWQLRASANGLPDITRDVVPLNGVPLVAAVALLLAAVLLARRLAVVVAAAAFLAGAVATVAVQELAWQRAFQPAGATVLVPDLGVSQRVGYGFWLLAAAVVLAAAATLVAVRRSSTVLAPGEREEPETPPLGIPVVVRLPDEPPNPAAR